MSEPETNMETFDVFLCHNGEDKPEIRHIARQLAENGIAHWLDEEQIRPGTSWQTALGEQIENIKSAAIFVGESGIGPWQDQEIQALLSQFVKRKCPVIPVVLPSARETPKLPWTLQNLHWVDFRVASPNPLKQLIWGITGEKPDKSDSLPKDSSYSDSGIPQGTDLFPPKEKKIIELRLSGDLSEFTDEAKMVLFESLNKLMNIVDVKLTKVAAGSVRLYLELDPEDADKLYSAGKEGQLADIGISEARLYPAIANPPESEQRAQLIVLLDRVNEYWIDGVLKHSLYNEVLISLGKHAMDEAVEPPWKHFLELPEQRRHLILKDRSTRSVFDATGLLLILGEPGSGKTTTLLDLASSLISRAREDPKERVPIVLNLSSWTKKQSLDEWIASELSVKYRVPVKIGRSWLKNDYLLPLLDGLDEVQDSLRPACVKAINEFIDKFEPSGLVVCCRLMEYQWLPERLKLNGAICLELLGSEQVNEFISSAGNKLAGLRRAMCIDPVLQELSQTPLMLSIMSLSYEGVGGDDLEKQKAGSHEERREQILILYIERMLKRKELDTTPFTKEKVIGWITWLAKGMKDHSQSVFMVEGLQPNWLANRRQQLYYKIFSTLAIAIICLTIVGLGFGLLGFQLGGLLGFHLGTMLGMLSGGLICLSTVHSGSLMTIHPVEKVSWETKNFLIFFGKEKTRNRYNAICVAVGIIVGILKGWLLGFSYYFVALSLVVFGGLLIESIRFDKIDKLEEEKVHPNQGIVFSFQNSYDRLIWYGLFGGISGFSLGLFLVLMVFNLKDALFFSMTLGLLIGLVLGLIASLYRGGSAVVKHYCLRFILWITGSTPFKFIKFLDYCAKLILLKKVGGGYMFIHRIFLEHFAKMELESPKTKKSK